MKDSIERLRRYYVVYTICFVLLIAALAALEQQGMPPRWIGYAFLFFTIMIITSSSSSFFSQL